MLNFFKKNNRTNYGYPGNYQMPYIQNEPYYPNEMNLMDTKMNELKREINEIQRRIARIENYLGIRGE